MVYATSMLSAFRNLTVITYDLLIALEIARTSNRLIVAGGELRRGSVTLADTFTLSMTEQFFVQKAFISADAVDIDHGYMDCNPYEIAIKRRMIENANHPVMLLDSSKFEARAFAISVRSAKYRTSSRTIRWILIHSSG